MNPNPPASEKRRPSETPLMQQYFKLKAKYKDAILLFRVGDFYETFGEDAIKTSQATGVVLTRRNNGGSDIELAGFPYHAMDIYMPKLVKAGLRVAICEQLEKPSKEKKIVKRGVTEVITPGLTTDDKLLDHRNHNFLASIHQSRNGRIGVALIDISTGTFLATEGDGQTMHKVIQQYQPAEILLTKSQDAGFRKIFGEGYCLYHLEEWVFTDDYAIEKLRFHFSVTNLKGFGLEESHAAQVAAGAILHYLAATENSRIGHIRSISRIHIADYAWLDAFTIRNLELIQTLNPNGKSLLQVIDDTVTPMGARLLRHWLLMPLLDIQAINERLDIVRYFIEHPQAESDLSQTLRQIGDLERLLSKAVLGKIAPRELLQLARSLQGVDHIRQSLLLNTPPVLQTKAHGLDACDTLSKRITATIQPDPPSLLMKGNVIQTGCEVELDDLRHLIANSKEILLQMQQEESKRTGIPNLKIGFNNVFGYYLEVSNKYKEHEGIPGTWIRKQTTANGERYVTQELKRLEERILTAEEKIQEVEVRIYENLVNTIRDFIAPIQQNATILAQLDVLAGFARNALRRQYCRPVLEEGRHIRLTDSRHPVIEAQMPPGDQYVPNDIFLEPDTQQIMMITGPNMSGKSAILRQTALICLMAQIGSYVPAAAATLGVVDKIFTRVGASDNISSGESTFMVEMSETASIMNNISPRSLILLDEIGRGTATYDGISIAWAIAEYLHENDQCRPKTLFATHYHELNELTNRHSRIKNFHIATQETGNRVLFLRKLKPGGSEHSFGIHVARMAGMPKRIIQRSQEILAWLESQRDGQGTKVEPASTPQPAQAYQLSFFDVMDPGLQEVKRAILDLELNQLTPIECMLKLQELKTRLQDNG